MYRFLEHTADMFLEAKGQTFQEALEQASLGMFSLMGGKEATEKSSIVVKVNASTKDELVVLFLSEILAECEIREFTPVHLKIEKFNEKNGTITARIYGENKTPKNIIKAVTYHQLDVVRGPDGWTIKVLFDI